MDARNWLDGGFELEELLFCERGISERMENEGVLKPNFPAWLVAAATALKYRTKGKYYYAGPPERHYNLTHLFRRYCPER